jgi:membrane protein implicated in regulation of membrane protease activity
MEGVYKLFAVFTACLIGPVLLFWGLFELMRGIGWLVSHYWFYMLGAAILALLIYYAWRRFRAWLARYVIRQQQARANRRRERLYQQTMMRMQDIARNNPGGFNQLPPGQGNA